MSGFYATHPHVSFSPYDDEIMSDSSEDIEAGVSETRREDAAGQTPTSVDAGRLESEDVSCDDLQRSRIAFHSQEHSFIQEVFPDVPSDLVGLIREFTQVTLKDEVSTAETKHAMSTAMRHKELVQAAFFVVFGFVLTLASAVLFTVDIYPGSTRWYWPLLICPAVMNISAVPSTAEILNLHMRTRKYLWRLRFVCWLGLAIELVARQAPPSIFLFVPLLIESIFSIYKGVLECCCSRKPPLALVHICTEQHAVTLWTIADMDDSAAEIPEFPPPQHFELVGWYPLKECQLTLYTAPDRMWYSHSVAKLEAHNPKVYHHAGSVVTKQHVSMHVLVPRGLQNLMLAKHGDFLECFTIKTEFGGVYSGDRRPVLLTDLFREHVLDGYF